MITIMAGVAQNTAYATNIITVQRYFYKQIWSYSYQIMLVLSTQLIGFSMGAFCWIPLLTRLSRLTRQSYPSRWPLETLPSLVRLLVYLSRLSGADNKFSILQASADDLAGIARQHGTSQHAPQHGWRRKLDVGIHLEGQGALSCRDITPPCSC